MNTENTVNSLTEWIESLKELAREDLGIAISWFGPTVNKPFSIVAGWSEQPMYSNYSDIFCSSETNPNKVMCVKIVVNEGSHICEDFDKMKMPIDKSGKEDDTCIVLEWDDDASGVAKFFFVEWERIMKEHGEEV